MLYLVNEMILNCSGVHYHLWPGGSGAYAAKPLAPINVGNGKEKSIFLLNNLILILFFKKNPTIFTFYFKF